MATAAGIETVICSGARDGVLARVLAGGREGTLFAPRGGRYSSFKLWLRYSKPTRGTIVVDAGAARALREGGTSLLPVGIVEVRGEFGQGDAVEVVHGPALIGKGICNYPAAELRAVAGRNPPRSTSCSRTRSRRPSTATTSSSRNNVRNHQQLNGAQRAIEPRTASREHGEHPLTFPQHGHDHRRRGGLPRRQAAPRARSRASTRRSRTPRSRASPARSTPPPPRSSMPTTRTSRPRARRASRARSRPPDARRAPDRGDGRGRARDRGAARSGRRGRRGLPPSQRAARSARCACRSGSSP